MYEQGFAATCSQGRHVAHGPPWMNVSEKRRRPQAKHWSERMARSWWASKRVSELELQTPLTV
ncbi:unnamed protein product, partial [Ectocarpus sp. 13 AM-2016]